MFWTKKSSIGNRSVLLREAGQQVVQSLIDFVANLSPEESAVVGITMLNEPALAAWPFYDSFESVLRWLADGAERFRRSQLHEAGVQLYVNLQKQALPLDTRSSFWLTAKAWFEKTFTQDERESWAVFDMHYYAAWNRTCGGCTDWAEHGACFGEWPAWSVDPKGGFACNSSQAVSVTKSCVQDFIAEFSHFVPSQKAVSEMSAGTWTDQAVACKQHEVTQAFLQEQAAAFRAADIPHYFWSWKLPYGPDYEPGWSLRWLAHGPESSIHHCAKIQA